MAVPGPVTSPMSAGCHDLLRREVDRALLVTCADDVLAVVGSVGEGLDARAGPGGGEADARAELDLLDPVARRVFEGLPARRFASAQEIAERSGVGPLDVIRALPTLDLADLIETGRSGYRIAARLRRLSSRGTGPSRGDNATGDPEPE
jgi:DNA processing protein